MSAIVPVPRCAMTVRPACLGDVPFMDSLQKQYSKALGYFPTKQFEEYVESGGVLVAEQRSDEATKRRSDGGMEEDSSSPALLPTSLSPHLSSPSSLRRSVAPSLPLGYIISRDRYLKRDELGVIFQLCVAPGVQRKLVGAALVREVFARSAYGCKLYCCWCAQDLEANWFWESLGFVPIAFRAGSSGKKRVHIFWQRRIDAESDEATERRSDEGNSEARRSRLGPCPYWYPFQTCSGAIRADRVVFPIPPGVHWRDVRAVELPERRSELGARHSEKALPGPRSRTPKAERRTPGQPGPGKVGIVVGGRIKYIDRPGYDGQSASEPAAPAAAAAAAKGARAKRTAEKACAERSRKIDPKFLKGARELRDRWLEKLNSEPQLLIGNAKYEVARALGGPGVMQITGATPLLTDAA